MSGFRITKMHCDQEFKPLMDPVKDEMNIEMFYPPAGDHVSEAERNNRIMEERIRIQYHRVPFTQLPREMWKALVSSVAAQLNFFPAENGVSKAYSPWQIMGNPQLDYKKHFVASCLLYTSPSPRDLSTSRMPSSA